MFPIHLKLGEVIGKNKTKNRKVMISKIGVYLARVRSSYAAEQFGWPKGFRLSESDRLDIFRKIQPSARYRFGFV